MPDLNDALVTVAQVARDAGVDVETLNRTWHVIVRPANPITATPEKN